MRKLAIFLIYVSLILVLGFGSSVRAEEAQASITLPALKLDHQKQFLKIATQKPNEFLKLALKHYQSHIKDYTCTFIKQEFVGGRYTKEQHIKVKFREGPFAIFMKWVKNAELVDKVLYIKGKYGNKALVKPAGILGWFVIGHIKRSVDGPDAAKVSRRRLDQFGFANALRLILSVNERAKKKGDLTFRFLGCSEFAGRKTYKFERILPDKPDYPDQRMVVHIDREWLIPIATFCYNARGKLLGKYIYKDIKLNIGLAWKEFTPQANGL